MGQTPSLLPQYNQDMHSLGLQGSCQTLGKPLNIRARKLIVIEHFSWFDTRRERKKSSQEASLAPSSSRRCLHGGPSTCRPGRKQDAQFWEQGREQKRQYSVSVLALALKQHSWCLQGCKTHVLSLLRNKKNPGRNKQSLKKDTM